VETLSPNLPAAPPSTATYPRAEFSPITPPEKTTEDYKYRYMFEKVTERSEGMLLPGYRLKIIAAENLLASA
jgi:hypothetical protein